MNNGDSVLQGKNVLIVDDEPDVLETVAEELEMCLVDKAMDFSTAIQYLSSYAYDLVILDIMGVNGFELLRSSVERGFPTVMLTGHAMTCEALKNAMKLGATSFLPKEKMHELKTFLEDVIKSDNKSAWTKVFERFQTIFDKKFGPDWEKRDPFFAEFEKEIKKCSPN